MSDAAAVSASNSGGEGGSPGVWRFVGTLIRPYRPHLAAAVTFNAIHGLAITFQIFVAAWLVDWVLADREGPWVLALIMRELRLEDTMPARLVVPAASLPMRSAGNHICMGASLPEAGMAGQG